MKRSTKYIILLIIAALIITVPLFLRKDAAFEGADGQAEEAIAEIDPDYEPWFSPLMEPASGEIESLLFCLQAALGAGVIGYFIGFVRGKRKTAEDMANNTRLSAKTAQR